MDMREKAMDKRLDDILDSLLRNIETLDATLMRLHRSELLYATEGSFGRLEQVRDACISALQAAQSIERKLQGAAFVLPAQVAQRLDEQNV